MSIDKKKIVLALPTLHSGGMERVMSELANYFSEFSDTSVHLILFGKKPEVFYQLTENVTVHTANKHSFKIIFIDLITRIIFLRNIVKFIKPNAVLTFGVQWNIFVLLALYKTKIPVFISDRGNPKTVFKFSTEFMKTLLYKNAHGFIAQTEKAAEVVHSRFPKLKLRVIGNPIKIINNNKFEKENLIISLGRLISTKHHDRLIDIFSKLNAPNWKLVIVGGDAIKQENSVYLKNKIQQLNLSEKVELTGTKKNVDDYLIRSKIFAFTSSSEGFPNVVGEALSAGLPVVSYDCMAGPSEMIISGINGFLVDVFDDESFQKYLQLLIDNEKLLNTMSNEAQKSIDKFSIKTIGKKYFDFLTNE